MEYKDLSTAMLQDMLDNLDRNKREAKALLLDAENSIKTDGTAIKRVIDQRAEIELLKKESEIKYSLKQLRAAFTAGYDQGYYNGGSGNGQEAEFNEGDFK